jgi:hypothetical protein
MKSLHLLQFAVLVILAGNAAAAEGDPFDAGVMPGLNFKGKNICFSVGKLPVADLPYDALPNPIVQSTSSLDGDAATHLVTYGDFGSITLQERLGDDELCANLPLNRFSWQVDAVDGSGRASFCISAVGAEERIRVDATANLNPNEGAKMTQMLGIVGSVGSCSASNHPGWFYPEDRIVLGSHVRSYIDRVEGQE